MTLEPLIQDAEAHKGMASVMFMWFMRELPVFNRWIKGTLWPALVAIYPYCRDNGGVGGIIKSFFAGKPKTP